MEKCPPEFGLNIPEVMGIPVGGPSFPGHEGLRVPPRMLRGGQIASCGEPVLGEPVELSFAKLAGQRDNGEDCVLIVAPLPLLPPRQALRQAIGQHMSLHEERKRERESDSARPSFTQVVLSALAVFVVLEACVVLAALHLPWATSEQVTFISFASFAVVGLLAFAATCFLTLAKPPQPTPPRDVETPETPSEKEVWEKEKKDKLKRMLARLWWETVREAEMVQK